MKIVVAEKVAPSSLAVFKEQSDWVVVSPEKDALAAELAEADALLVRSAVFVDAAMMDQGAEVARHRARGRGRGQYRSRRGHQARHRSNEYARRKRNRRSRAHAGADAGAGTAPDARRLHHARRQVGEEVAARHGVAGQDAGHRRVGEGRHGSRQAGAVVRDEGHRARSVCRSQPGAAVADHAGSVGGTIRAVGLHHAARGADTANAGNDQRRHASEDEEGRPADKLRARRVAGRRGRRGRSGVGPVRRRCAGCVSRRAAEAVSRITASRMSS